MICLLAAARLPIIAFVLKLESCIVTMIPVMMNDDLVNFTLDESHNLAALFPKTINTAVTSCSTLNHAGQGSTGAFRAERAHG